MRKVAGALQPGGRAVILEFVPNDDRISPPMAAAFSLTMLAGTPSGATYTLAELREMVREAGFSFGHGASRAARNHRRCDQIAPADPRQRAFGSDWTLIGF